MQTQNIIRIVAAVVDTRQLTLYKENGETLHIPQGDPRIRDIVSTATPELIRQGWADVNLTPAQNSYGNFEEASNGAVRFFRVAKAKLKSLFSSQIVVPPSTVGTIPPPPKEQDVNTAMAAFEEIMDHAIPVTSSEFNEEGLDTQAPIAEANGVTPNAHTATVSEDTIIAVTDGKVIPGMEKIKNQFERASRLGSTEGVENFLKRLGSVIDQRSHSVDDLLKFMERGDLPIADDGSILIYKVLRKSIKGKYVDCHTGLVEQWVGAFVCMDHSLVDHNRNNECSNGLHVARRGYISRFSGDVCTLCKLAPEDVIAVPTYDANKMRVCGYHILFELSDEQYTMVKRNQPITDNESGRILLGKAIHGDHIGRTHEVRITRNRGGGVITTPLMHMEQEKPEQIQKEEALANSPMEDKANMVDPKAVAQDVTDQAKKAPSRVSQLVMATHGEGSPRERIQKLLALGLDTPGTAAAIIAVKRKAKKGWDVLGVSPDVVEAIQQAIE